MVRTLMTPEQALRILAETPARIAAATQRLEDAQLVLRPAEDEWSANEVLAHLRACADVRGSPIPRILSEGQPTIRTTDPRSYLLKTDYLSRQFRPSFEAFAEQRSELVHLLDLLPAASWARSAIITGAGQPKAWSVLFYADWLARHERPHVKQIEAVARSLRS